jgi:hypothetical protein
LQPCLQGTSPSGGVGRTERVKVKPGAGREGSTWDRAELCRVTMLNWGWNSGSVPKSHPSASPIKSGSSHWGLVVSPSGNLTCRIPFPTELVCFGVEAGCLQRPLSCTLAGSHLSAPLCATPTRKQSPTQPPRPAQNRFCCLAKPSSLFTLEKGRFGS